MRFANRVVLQGYLDIQRVETISLDGKSGLSAPVVHGVLELDASGIERQPVVIADRPAVALLEILHRYQPGVGSALVNINGMTVEVAQLNGKPFVAVEGSLISGTVAVKHITVLSVPEAGLLRLLMDHRLREIVYGWEEIREADRMLMYRIVREAREAREPLSLTALGHGAPAGAGGGLTSTPPAPRRAAPEG
ncbi:MAG: hypothetical protein AB1457_17875 [Chloroflexota bacterium]